MGAASWDGVKKNTLPLEVAGSEGVPIVIGV